MKKLNALLVFLISSLAITGVSFIDGKIWNVIFLVVGMIAYAIRGIMFSIGVLHGKKAGKEAFVGSWVVQECAEAVARHYLDRKRHRPAHSMKIEVINTDTMETIGEYEIV